MDNGKLSVKSIGEILSGIEPSKKLHYSADYIRDLYLDYQRINCDDSMAIQELTTNLKDKQLLLLGPGKNIEKERNKVDVYISINHPIVISVNFIPGHYDIDYVFMSNAKRYVQLSSLLNEQHDKFKLIAASNITKAEGEFDYTLNNGSLLEEEALIPDNPLIMLLKLFKRIGIKKVGLAGFDGYSETSLPNYANPNMEYMMSCELAKKINMDVIREIDKLDLSYSHEFITTSLYMQSIKENERN